MTRTEIAERAAYSAASGAFRSALSRLKTLELIEGHGDTKAADILFDEAL